MTLRRGRRLLLESEFHRLRLAYARTTDNVPGRRAGDSIGLQWTGVFGKHVHGFRDR